MPSPILTIQQTPNIANWFEILRTAITDNDPKIMYRAFMTCTQVVFYKLPYVPIHRELRVLGSISAVRSLVEQEMNDEWLGINEAAIAYLWFLESADLNIVTYASTGFEEQTAVYFDRMKQLLKALNGCFSSPRGTVLNLTMKKLCKWLVVVAKCLDNMNGDPSKYESSTLLNPILRAFNISLAERTPYTAPDQLLKKQVSLDLGNYLFRLYAKLLQNKLAPTIHGNLAAAEFPIEYPLFSRPTLCTYNYFRGIQLMNDTTFVQAAEAFSLAYTLCHPRYIRHRRMILIPLLAVSLILGRFPSIAILSVPEAEGLAELFVPVCRAIQKGDFRAFRIAMGTQGPDRWKAAWWDAQRLARLFDERCNVLLWRSLIRRIWILTRTEDPQGLARVRIDDIHACAVALHRVEPEDMDPQRLQQQETDPYGTTDPWSCWYDGLRLTRDQVEGIAMSLLDQTLIKGYLVRPTKDDESSILVLSKKDPFPNIWKLRQEHDEKNLRQPLFQPGTMGGGRVVQMSGVKEIGEK